MVETADIRPYLSGIDSAERKELLTRAGTSKGRFEQQFIWLRLVIAHLWAGRVVAAAKHGLPFRRVETVYFGRALRGRLLPRNTALLRAVGDDRVARVTRIRVVDPVIGGILLGAFERLRAALGSHGQKNY
jgi:hypothetical protein